jgi:hypothetical protein
MAIALKESLLSLRDSASIVSAPVGRSSTEIRRPDEPEGLPAFSADVWVEWGMADGSAAGQTAHAYVHLIPHYRGDVADRRGPGTHRAIAHDRADQPSPGRRFSA